MRNLTPALAALAATSLSLSPLAAPAQDQPESELAPVVVTATRTAETVDDTLSPVTVIDRDEIDRSGVQDFRELLRSRAGMQLTNQGGMGKSTNLYMRGTSQQGVKFLVDGLEYTSATTGTPSFQFLPLSQIERVEVVRGPRSSLYGADAVGGIVQVFTRKGGQGVHPFASAGIGSNQTRKGRAGVSGGAGSFHYAFAGDYFETQGFDSYKAREPDADGFRRRSGNIRLGYDGPGFEADAHFLHSEGTSEYDWTGFGTPNNETAFVQQVGGLSVTAHPMEAWFSTLRGGRSRDRQRSLASGEKTDLFQTTRDQAVWQNDVRWGEGQVLTVGGDYHVDRIESTREYSADSRWNWGGFVQQQLSHGDHDFNFNLRHDDNQAFGGYTTGSAAWGYRLDSVWRVTASYGTAFRAPTFNELYYPDVGYYKGNPNLDPESSRSADIGLIARPEWGRVALHAFRTRIDDLIVNDCVQQGPGYCAVYAPVNLDQAEITGIELETRARSGPWHVATDLTLQDPVNPDTGNQLPKRSRNTARVDVNRAFGRLTAGAEWIGKSYKYDDTANTVRVPGYGLVNLYASLRMGRDWTLRGRVENLMDRAYESESGYRARGRYGVVELAYARGGSGR